MSTDPVERLVAESARLRPVGDPVLDALRRAQLVEDVLGVRLTDAQIDVAFLSDPEALRGLVSEQRRL